MRRRRSGLPVSRRRRSVASSPKAAGVELDRAGRVKVETDCTLPGHPEVFVIGDLMSLDNLPGVTQVAIQSGRHAADTIIRRLAGDTTRRPFRYRDFGTMAIDLALARGRRVRQAAHLRLPRVGALAPCPPRRRWPASRTALSVLFNWTVAFLGRGRAQRVITAQQVFARHALEAHTRRAALRRRFQPPLAPKAWHGEDILRFAAFVSADTKSRCGNPGFEDVVRHLTVVVGAAFELPVTLSVSGLHDTSEPSRGLPTRSCTGTDVGRPALLSGRAGRAGH